MKRKKKSQIRQQPHGGNERTNQNVRENFHHHSEVWKLQVNTKRNTKGKQKFQWNRENKHAAIAKWWQWAYKPECLSEFPPQFRGFRITSQYNGFTKKKTEKQTETRKNQRKQHAATAKWWEWAYRHNVYTDSQLNSYPGANRTSGNSRMVAMTRRTRMLKRKFTSIHTSRSESHMRQ